MLLIKNIFPIDTRGHTHNLFSQNHVSTMLKYNNNFSSFENHKRRRKKSCYIMKSQKIEHPRRYFQLKAITNDEAEDEKQIIISQKGNNGIGIIDFFEGKNIFVTGGTGFLAKALIEKILRTTPKINKIYLLIRAKDKEAAFHRLKFEIMESELFKCPEEIHGESYKLFIQNKLIPIVGNIYEPNLGMDIITSQQIAQQIDLIVDSAAITTFDERYDLALDANHMLMEKEKD
uniref:Fatty acyl-CoA reductase n=1 Tax=Solanum lycopersicum TaxID=4081 RepID=A0A3Q7HXG0_SOLLC